MAGFDGVSGGEDPDAASRPGSNGPTSGFLDPSTFPPAAPDKAAPDGSNISVQPIETEIADGPPLERSAPLISGPLDTDTHAEVLRDIQNAQAQLPPVSPRSVYSLGGGFVSAAGWQKPNNHRAGMGWRVYVTEPDGSRIGYGHMDPSSTPSVGMQIQPGGLLGQYASPTNGHSSAPHVHVQRYDAHGDIVDPGAVSPLRGPSTISSPFQSTGRMHTQPHQGVDWMAGQ